MANHGNYLTLLNTASSTGAGDGFEVSGSVLGWTAFGTATSFTAQFEGSQDGVNWVPLPLAVTEGSPANSAAFAVGWIRANLVAVSGGSVTLQAVSRG